MARDNDDASPTERRVGGRRHEDIDVALLHETGRASAVQDLKDLAVELAEAGKTFQRVVLDQQRDQLTLWRRIARGLIITGVLLAIGLTAALWLAIDNRDIVTDTRTIVEELEEQDTDLTAIQEDIASVREFVARTEDRRERLDPSVDQALEAIARIENSLCGGPCPAPGGAETGG